MNENLFKTRLIEAMNNKKVKQVDLVKNTGIAKSSISQYLKGLVIPKQDKVYLLANYLNVDPGWLWGLDVNSDDDITAIHKQLNTNNKHKVLDYAKTLLERQNNASDAIKEHSALYKVQTIEKLSAGHGYAYGENEVTTYYTDRNDFKPYDVASVVHGNSMIPKYNNGDVVLIKNGYDHVNGAVYAVDYNGESYLKRVFFEGDRIRLVSFNRDYEDIYIYLPLESDVYLNIIGKVVDSFKPIKP